MGKTALKIAIDRDFYDVAIHYLHIICNAGHIIEYNFMSHIIFISQKSVFDVIVMLWPCFFEHLNSHDRARIIYLAVSTRKNASWVTFVGAVGIELSVKSLLGVPDNDLVQFALNYAWRKRWFEATRELVLLTDRAALFISQKDTNGLSLIMSAINEGYHDDARVFLNALLNSKYYINFDYLLVAISNSDLEMVNLVLDFY